MRAAARMNGRLESRPTGRLESLPYINPTPNNPLPTAADLRFLKSGMRRSAKTPLRHGCIAVRASISGIYHILQWLGQAGPPRVAYVSLPFFTVFYRGEAFQPAVKKCASCLADEQAAGKPPNRQTGKSALRIRTPGVLLWRKISVSFGLAAARAGDTCSE
jgi:hypothetical protein